MGLSKIIFYQNSLGPLQGDGKLSAEDNSLFVTTLSALKVKEIQQIGTQSTVRPHT